MTNYCSGGWRVCISLSPVNLSDIVVSLKIPSFLYVMQITRRYSCHVSGGFHPSTGSVKIFTNGTLLSACTSAACQHRASAAFEACIHDILTSSLSGKVNRSGIPWFQLFWRERDRDAEQLICSGFDLDHFVPCSPSRCHIVPFSFSPICIHLIFQFPGLSWLQKKTNLNIHMCHYPLPINNLKKKKLHI